MPAAQAMTGECMLILLVWSGSLPTQINPPVPAVYPTCTECWARAEEGRQMVPLDVIAGVKAVRYTPACIQAPVAPEPAPAAEAKKEPETAPQRKGWGR